MSTASVADCVEVLETAYDPAWAADWDAVGLAVGDPAAPVMRVLLAVDPTAEVAAEAGAYDLLVTHHPLFLRGVHSVADTTPGGRVAAALVRSGTALFSAHTNADVALPGVSDAMAVALGLVDLEVLRPDNELLDHLAVYVPTAARAALLDALAAAGAGELGDYDRCAWWTSGTGTFRPGALATPTIGTPGLVEEVGEDRLEMVVPRRRRRAVVEALRSAHPYEEPAFVLTEMALPSRRGLGRVGALPAAESLSDLLRRTAKSLPATAGAVRAASPDGDRLVRRVAVVGGAGDDCIADAVRASADALVTSDLRHHRTRDAVEAGLAVVDVPHWSAEWPWLAQAAGVLRKGLAARGHTVDTEISTLVTDPWWASVAHAPGEGPTPS